MICKECGAYNSDHATFCKVCAANLKGETAEPLQDTPVEDDRPTQRFVRPTWSVPTYSKPEPVAEEIEKEEELIAQEPVNEAEETEQAEELPQESEETEESEKITPPVSRRRPVYVAIPDEEEDDEEDADQEEDEYEDDEYEYEPTAPKRSSGKKASNTLFWVLLIAIILVILAIVGVFLFAIFGKDKGAESQDRPGLFSCAGNAEDATTDPSDAPVDAVQPTEIPASSDTVLLEETVSSEGVACIKLTILTPVGYRATIVLPNRDENYEITNTQETAVNFSVDVPKSVFYPDAPLTESTVALTPVVYLTAPDGTRKDLEVPSFYETFPTLSIQLEAPVRDENGAIMASVGNVVHVRGTVADHKVVLTANDEQQTVYSGGRFEFDYTLSGAESETVKLVASKENHVSTELEFTVDPYVFIPDPMVLTLTNSPSALRVSDKSVIAITGTTLPGATLTATSDNTSNVICDSATVDAQGNYSFNVNFNEEFNGLATITLSATKEGAEDGSIRFFVSRMKYEDKDEFVGGFYHKTSSKNRYLEVNNDINITELLANIDTYSTGEYAFRVNGKVEEIIEENGYIIAKIKVKSSGETVYVLNMSEKWQPQENIGSSYRAYSTCLGTYGDTGCAYFACWFAKVLD